MVANDISIRLFFKTATSDTDAFRVTQTDSHPETHKILPGRFNHAPMQLLAKNFVQTVTLTRNHKDNDPLYS